MLRLEEESTLKYLKPIIKTIILQVFLCMVISEMYTPFQYYTNMCSGFVDIDTSMNKVSKQAFVPG